MAARALVLGAAVAGSIPAGTALANTVYTDSWGCAWQASSYYSNPNVNSYTAEDLPYNCSSQVGLVFSYLHNGTCTYGSWQWQSSWIVSNYHAGSGVQSSHQIYVPGHGYGQVVATYYPYDGVC